MFLFKNNLKEHLDIFVNSKHLVVASFFLVLNFISSLLHKRNVFDLNHVIHWHFPTAFFTIPTSFYCEETCFDFITKLCMWHRAQKAEFGGHGSRLCAPMSPDSLPQKPSLPCALRRLLPEVLLPAFYLMESFPAKLSASSGGLQRGEPPKGALKKTFPSYPSGVHMIIFLPSIKLDIINYKLNLE